MCTVEREHLLSREETLHRRRTRSDWNRARAWLGKRRARSLSNAHVLDFGSASDTGLMSLLWRPLTNQSTYPIVAAPTHEHNSSPPSCHLLDHFPLPNTLQSKQSFLHHPRKYLHILLHCSNITRNTKPLLSSVCPNQTPHHTSHNRAR